MSTPLIGDYSAAPEDAALRAVRVGVITFPGTLDDRDAARAVQILVDHYRATMSVVERYFADDRDA